MNEWEEDMWKVIADQDRKITKQERHDMKHCPWCYEPAEHGVWTPRHGWIDLCQRHHMETSREVISHLRQQLATEEATK